MTYKQALKIVLEYADKKERELNAFGANEYENYMEPIVHVPHFIAAAVNRRMKYREAKEILCGRT